MTDPLQALIDAGALPAVYVAPTSRYAATPIVHFDPGDGRPAVPYLARRLLPAPEELATLGEHIVVAGDRLDLLADRYLGDPQLYWRICDANVTLHPQQLTAEPGRRLRITLPEGVPGGGDA